MHRRHPPGHQARAVGLAHRACDIEAVEGGAARGDGIDVRRAQHRMAVAAQKIGAVLVGDEQQKIGTGGIDFAIGSPGLIL